MPNSPCIDIGDPNYIQNQQHIVVDEGHIATAFAPVELDHSNIDMSTIVVKDSTGLLLFNEGDDYSIIEIDGRTYLEIFIPPQGDSQVPNFTEGQESFVDYNYLPQSAIWDLDGNPRIVNGIIDMGAYEAPLGPLYLLIELSEHVGALDIPKGLANSLQVKLGAAMKLLGDGNKNNDKAAINLLEAFINAVGAQAGKKIPQGEAEALILAAQEIIELLGG